MKDRYFTVNIREYLQGPTGADANETSLDRVLSDFSCPINVDVEHFLKTNAAEFTRKNQSITHLVFDKNLATLAGYFTLAIKPISIQLDKISKTVAKKLSRVSTFNEETNSFTAAAYLLAQLGKNCALDKREQISGELLLEAALAKILETQYIVGGVVEFLECEDNDFLLDFYSRNYFKPFDTRLVVSDDGETRLLHQLLRLI